MHLDDDLDLDDDLRLCDDDDVDDADGVFDAVFVGRATDGGRRLAMGEHVEPLRGELSLRGSRRRPLLRDDDDELRSDDDDDDDLAGVFGFLRLLVAPVLGRVGSHDEQLRNAGFELQLLAPVLLGFCLRTGRGSLHYADDLDDDDDGGVLAMLYLDDDVDDDDDRRLLGFLSIQMVDRRFGVVQNRRPLRLDLSLSFAVENVVGRFVRGRAGSLCRNDDDDVDDLDLDDLDDNNNDDNNNDDDLDDDNDGPLRNVHLWRGVRGRRVARDQLHRNVRLWIYDERPRRNQRALRLARAVAMDLPML